MAGNPQERRLLVVDDDAGLRDMVGEYLSRHGFTVFAAADGAEMDRRLGEDAPDLILLDVSMPGEDGFAIARRLRAARIDIPVIMLTAMGETIDRVVGLELGTDDYVVKPFDLRELRARIGAVLRRTGKLAVRADSTHPTAAGTPDRRIAFGKVRLDLESRRLVRADGSEQHLTAMEFDLLRAFAENPNRVLSRDRLLELAHHRDKEPFDRSIDIRIARLRRKIEEEPASRR
jgi:two-component system phosphate regulon response regulator OmpR